MTKAEAVLKTKAYIAGKYSHLSNGDISTIYDTALAIYLSLSYPFDKSIIDIPDTCLRDMWWIQQCMVEIIERDGISSQIAYRENGLSMDFDSSCISAFLRSAIIPKAGVVCRTV